MVAECIQYAFSKWGNSSHNKLKTNNNKKTPYHIHNKTNYTIAIKRRRKNKLYELVAVEHLQAFIYTLCIETLCIN